MKFGVAVFGTEYSISPVELAQLAEQAGFESLWVPEHTHIPVDEATRPDGTPLPEEYKHTLDPFVVLAAAAAATSTLLLATGVCLVVERDPIVTAKEVATLDVLSGGRFLFGVGGGWNRTEMSNHGTDPRTRFSLLEERLEAMKAIWTSGDEPASYAGRFVSFGPLWSWPKPVQSPSPPVLLGGNGPRTLERVVRFADGWMPNPMNAETFAARIDELQRLASEAGRSRIPVTAFGCRPSAEGVAQYAEIGVDRCVFWVPASNRDEALRAFDGLAGFVGSSPAGR